MKTEDKALVAAWLELTGGIYDPILSSRTTHLVCVSSSGVIMFIIHYNHYNHSLNHSKSFIDYSLIIYYHISFIIHLYWLICVAQVWECKRNDGKWKFNTVYYGHRMDPFMHGLSSTYWWIFVHSCNSWYYFILFFFYFYVLLFFLIYIFSYFFIF